jgi:hypothetical protein
MSSKTRPLCEPRATSCILLNQGYASADVSQTFLAPSGAPQPPGSTAARRIFKTPARERFTSMTRSAEVGATPVTHRGFQVNFKVVISKSEIRDWIVAPPTAAPTANNGPRLRGSRSADRAVTVRFRDITLIQEQDRVTYQIAETEQLVDERFTTLAELRRGEAAAVAELAHASSQLEILTSEFVSARAAELQSVASEVATTRANLDWTQRYLELIERQAAKTSLLDDLKAQKEAIEENIENHRSGVSTAEENIQALEERMLDYLTRLHVPRLGELLTVRINRQNYLPEVSTRTFDELSSQGLKTLVNVAHALAHHAVAIDRNLEMPGLLVLDGVSANSGKEGFEFDRIVDMYELFDEVASAYGDELQLIVVDNDLPAEVNDKLASAIMLTLSQSDRLVGGSDDPSE